MNPQKIGAVMGKPQVEDEGKEDVEESKIDDKRTRSERDEEGPSLQVAEGRSQEQGLSGCREEREVDKGNVMRRLFNKEEASIKSQQQYPRDIGGISPNLPLVPYYDPEEYFINLAKAVRVYSACEKYKSSFNIGSNKGASSINN